MPLCFCGSEQAYQACCQPFHTGEKRPDSCEQLMRSRFSAFKLHLGEYLFQTWHPDSRQQETAAGLTQASQQTDWRSLAVLSSQGKRNDQQGQVEFCAWYWHQGALQFHHEISNFIKIDQQWLYVDGQFPASHKAAMPGRNAPCPCASGKKYKACCG